MTTVRALAISNKEITRNELILKRGISSDGDFSLKLEELMESGFISEYSYFQSKKQLSLYRLSEEYSKFYLKFIENNKTAKVGTWQRISKTQSFVS
jgi:hypothetical protein